MHSLNCISNILCFQFPSSFLRSRSQPKEKLELLVRTCGQERTKLVQCRMTIRTRAIADSLLLGVASPAKGGNISVLLQTSAVLLLAYGMANFIAPALISKFYEFDESKDPKDDSNKED